MRRDDRLLSRPPTRQLQFSPCCGGSPRGMRRLTLTQLHAETRGMTGAERMAEFCARPPTAQRTASRHLAWSAERGRRSEAGAMGDERKAA